MPEVQWETDQLKIDRIALGLLCPTAAATVSECLYHSLHLGLFVPNRMIWMVDWGPLIIFSVLGTYSVLISARWGREGTILGAAGLATAFFVIHTYRGSLFWPGVLDRDHLPKTWTFFSFAVALLVGSVLPRVIPACRRPSRWWESVAYMMIGIAITYSWADSQRELKLYTALAYTRHLALTTMTVVVVAWAGFATRWRQS